MSDGWLRVINANLGAMRREVGEGLAELRKLNEHLRQQERPPDEVRSFSRKLSAEQWESARSEVRAAASPAPPPKTADDNGGLQNVILQIDGEAVRVGYLVRETVTGGAAPTGGTAHRVVMGEILYTWEWYGTMRSLYPGYEADLSLPEFAQTVSLGRYRVAHVDLGGSASRVIFWKPSRWFAKVEDAALSGACN